MGQRRFGAWLDGISSPDLEQFDSPHIVKARGIIIDKAQADNKIYRCTPLERALGVVFVVEIAIEV